MLNNNGILTVNQANEDLGDFLRGQTTTPGQANGGVECIEFGAGVARYSIRTLLCTNANTVLTFNDNSDQPLIVEFRGDGINNNPYINIENGAEFRFGRCTDDGAGGFTDDVDLRDYANALILPERGQPDFHSIRNFRC